MSPTVSWPKLTKKMWQYPGDSVFICFVFLNETKTYSERLTARVYKLSRLNSKTKTQRLQILISNGL